MKWGQLYLQVILLEVWEFRSSLGNNVRKKRMEREGSPITWYSMDKLEEKIEEGVEGHETVDFGNQPDVILLVLSWKIVRWMDLEEGNKRL